MGVREAHACRAARIGESACLEFRLSQFWPQASLVPEPLRIASRANGPLWVLTLKRSVKLSTTTSSRRFLFSFCLVLIGGAFLSWLLLSEAGEDDNQLPGVSDSSIQRSQPARNAHAIRSVNENNRSNASDSQITPTELDNEIVLTVLDDQTSLPVVGADVSFVVGKKALVKGKTDENGQYKSQVIESGIECGISASGYISSELMVLERQSRTTVYLSKGHSLRIAFRTLNSHKPIEGVRVFATRTTVADRFVRGEVDFESISRFASTSARIIQGVSDTDGIVKLEGLGAGELHLFCRDEIMLPADRTAVRILQIPHDGVLEVDMVEPLVAVAQFKNLTAVPHSSQIAIKARFAGGLFQLDEIKENLEKKWPGSLVFVALPNEIMAKELSLNYVDRENVESAIISFVPLSEFQKPIMIATDVKSARAVQFTVEDERGKLNEFRNFSLYSRQALQGNRPFFVSHANETEEYRLLPGKYFARVYTPYCDVKRQEIAFEIDDEQNKVTLKLDGQIWSVKVRVGSEAGLLRGTKLLVKEQSASRAPWPMKLQNAEIKLWLPVEKVIELQAFAPGYLPELGFADSKNPPKSGTIELKMKRVQ